MLVLVSIPHKKTKRDYLQVSPFVLLARHARSNPSKPWQRCQLVPQRKDKRPKMQSGHTTCWESDDLFKWPRHSEESLPAQNTSLANKDLITFPYPSLLLQMNPVLQAEHVVKIRHTSSHCSKFTKMWSNVSEKWLVLSCCYVRHLHQGTAGCSKNIND